MRLAACNFAISIELQCSSLLRDAQRPLSLARSVRIHTTQIPISDIHLSPRERILPSNGDAIVPTAVAIIP